MILIHASDLHFGRPHMPEVARIFLRDIRAEPYDVLVVSGDLTQRAKVHEFEQVRAFLDSVADRPTVVTVGNHDVPLYRVFERLFDPYRNYRRFVSPELDTVTHVEGATLVALNSAAPRTAIVNGSLSRRQLAFAHEAFDRAAPGDARIAVIHHAMVRAPDYQQDMMLPGAAELTAALMDMGVELVLSGHLHRSYVAASGDVAASVPADPQVWLVHSGTTTSRRGRARERDRCTYNRIDVGEEHLRITTYIYEPDRTAFEPYRETILPRGGRRPGGPPPPVDGVP